MNDRGGAPLHPADFILNPFEGRGPYGGMAMPIGSLWSK